MLLVLFSPLPQGAAGLVSPLPFQRSGSVYTSVCSLLPSPLYIFIHQIPEYLLNTGEVQNKDPSDRNLESSGKRRCIQMTKMRVEMGRAMGRWKWQNVRAAISGLYGWLLAQSLIESGAVEIQTHDPGPHGSLGPWV